MRTIPVLLLSLLLASCETTSALPSSFTAANIMRVHQDMSADDVLQLFGDPKNIRSGVCGQPPNQWNCTTWEYGNSPYANASFTFSGEHGSYILNDFNIDRD